MIFDQHPDRIASVPPEDVLIDIKQRPCGIKLSPVQANRADIWILPWVFIVLSRKDASSVIELQTVCEALSSMLDSTDSLLSSKWKGFEDLLECRRLQLSRNTCDTLVDESSILHSSYEPQLHKSLLKSLCREGRDESELSYLLNLSRRRIREILMVLEEKERIVRKRVGTKTLVYLRTE